MAPNIILLLFPHYAAGEGGHSKILSLGQAMSAGALLGDVFLHALPHNEAASETAGAWVLVGFTSFLIVDMLIRSLEHHHHHHHHDGSASHQHASENGSAKEKNATLMTSSHHRSAALLNLAADALHNFTDGLAIGTSYAMHNADNNVTLAALLKSRGGLASVSIFLHEVPHELGDFCTLVRAGYSKSQAVLAQFSTAVAAFLGTAVALNVSEEDWAGERLLFVTAGGFVYLAATTLLPEVLEEGKSIAYRFLQLVSFVTGILFLYMVAYLEDVEEEKGRANLHHHHHHPHDMPHHPHDEHLHHHQEL